MCRVRVKCKAPFMAAGDTTTILADGFYFDEIRLDWIADAVASDCPDPTNKSFPWSVHDTNAVLLGWIV